ncbi:MAG: hypothetical protein PHX61_01855 [Alphaproteobacteria bacterium]|nr:hypothetical protein [Alphaproteobacteria bacterium]
MNKNGEGTTENYLSAEAIRLKSYKSLSERILLLDDHQLMLKRLLAMNNLLKKDGGKSRDFLEFRLEIARKYLDVKNSLQHPASSVTPPAPSNHFDSKKRGVAKTLLTSSFIIAAMTPSLLPEGVPPAPMSQNVSPITEPIRVILPDRSVKTVDLTKDQKLPSEKTIRETFNRSINRLLTKTDGMRYGFKADGRNGRINCSHFVAKGLQFAKKDLDHHLEINLDLGGMSTTSSGIFWTFAKSGKYLKGQDINPDTIKAGMVLTVDSGPKGYDRGRPLGIDHILITYRDQKTNILMVAQSETGRGPHATPLDDWLKIAQKRNYKLFATDPLTKIAEIQPVPDHVVEAYRYPFLHKSPNR